MNQEVLSTDYEVFSRITTVFGELCVFKLEKVSLYPTFLNIACMPSQVYNLELLYLYSYERLQGEVNKIINILMTHIEAINRKRKIPMLY